MHYLFLKCQNPYQLIMKNKELKTMPTGVTTAQSLEYMEEGILKDHLVQDPHLTNENLKVTLIPVALS